MSFRFTATRLAGTGKRGMLIPSSDGYYTMPVGGLNVQNSKKQVYVAQGAKELFEKSSIFMRRVREGRLKAEVDHPERKPGMSDDDYLNRIIRIDGNNVCAHFRSVWLDEEWGKKNPQYGRPDLIAIMAEVKPDGPKGAFLKARFDDPDQDVCFSIRCLTRDFYEGGVCYRVIRHLTNFDLVTEPGVNFATKWHSPGLETIDDFQVFESDIERLISKAEGIGMESAEIATECLHAMRSPVAFKAPLSYRW